MEKFSLKKLNLPMPTVQAILIGALIVGAFFIGSLWTKVQVLEKGGVAVAPSGAKVAPDKAAVPTTTPAAPKVAKDDHVRGDQNARIALIEYSDMECPYCKKFHETVKQLTSDYAGKIKWIYRHYPLSFHANAQKEAEAAECAGELGGNDAFWKYLDAVYERTTSNGTGFALDKLTPLAVELGLNESKFQSCLDSGKYTQKVKDQTDLGTKEGVSGTPGTILLDTKTGKTNTIPGAIPIEQIKPVIDEMLKG
jgi:protein-disulfide isomerase